jgi:crotonobetainyl-CoA:carnitine CoA-transferase CaiB-like acyl-CoA transferase
MPDVTEDPRFATNADRLRNREELETLIEQRFSTLSSAEVLARLDRAEIANGAVNDIAAVAQHPQLVARGRWIGVESPVGSIPALVPPHNLGHAPPRMGAVPALGQHSQEILDELGLAKFNPKEN